ncbi:hypothetical protein TrVGV298_001677 [Trichoderma virens]|nr:hypothetical protein TrVGV298_001677 [Trichoderma virens]
MMMRLSGNKHVYYAVTEATPPPQPLPIPMLPSTLQTPWSQNTSIFANSSEKRDYVDKIIGQELSVMHVGLPRFHEVFFGDVAGLQAASEAVFDKYQEDANQDAVLDWFAKLCDDLAALAKDHHPNSSQRRPLVQPNKPIEGSTVPRKLDVGFLRSNPLEDKPSKAWVDLGRYARDVLAAQDTRRFALGFTLCGSLIRVWEFNRLGAIASEEFNINKDKEAALRLVSTILGFLWMEREQLGFDPTINLEGDRRVVTIQRDDKTERLILDKLIKRAPCISGRATTCWKAYPEEDPQMPLVIKDSWQYTERDEEGELLKEATDKGVTNVARYYHHETVHVRSQVDEIHGNIRGGLISTDAKTYQVAPSSQLPDDESKSGQIAANRVHRRVIVRDYGKAIYMASTTPILLKALEDCIQGHEFLHKAGILHRNISVNNLTVNEDSNNPSWPSFLIDCDLAIKEN